MRPVLQTRLRLFSIATALLALLAAAGVSPRAKKAPGESVQGIGVSPAISPNDWQTQRAPEDESWRDSAGDGFPDSARLDSPEDRENFTRWVAFLAEAAYYHQSERQTREIQDCAALVRYAFRNALVAHTPAWRRAAGLPYEPGFGDVAKFSYPAWPLGRGLFRTSPGAFARADLARGVFAEFADTATLLHYNSFRISREIRAARPGDILFFYQAAGGPEPFHSMLFVGGSYFQSQGSDWIVYHTGDLGRRRGEVREVHAALLIEHPEPRWRPLAANPQFLGVYRFELLR